MPAPSQRSCRAEVEGHSTRHRGCQGVVLGVQRPGVWLRGELGTKPESQRSDSRPEWNEEEESIKHQTTKKGAQRVGICEQGPPGPMGKRGLCPQNILETLTAVPQTTR